MEAYALEVPAAAFSSSRACFEAMVSWLDGAQSAGLTHAELEDRLQTDGRKLLRQLYQDLWVPETSSRGVDVRLRISATGQR